MQRAATATVPKAAPTEGPRTRPPTVLCSSDHDCITNPNHGIPHGCVKDTVNKAVYFNAQPSTEPCTEKYQCVVKNPNVPA